VDYSQAMLMFVVLAPGVVFTVFALLWLAGWVPRERVLSLITGTTFSASGIALAAIPWNLKAAGAPVVAVSFGN
jgi:hypothetical protein